MNEVNLSKQNQLKQNRLRNNIKRQKDKGFLNIF